MEVPPETCVLHHPVFTRFGAPIFQRAETDGEPVMLVALGEKQAALPLRSLQREFSLGPETADGRMLALIAEALDFVTFLRPGDPLPAEILSGDASWEPEDIHLQIALARIRLALLAWLGGVAEARSDAEPEVLLAMAEDPGFRQRIQAAFTDAARALDLEGPDAVVAAIATLGQELAYIEALRARLWVPVRRVAREIQALGQRWRGDTSHGETLAQVGRLIGKALGQIRECFAQLDAQCADILAALGNDAEQQRFVRTNRDWLYRSLRGWQPILDAWEGAVEIDDRARWALIERTYRFLAPRFMSVKEWLADRQGRSKARPPKQMVW